MQDGLFLACPQQLPSAEKYFLLMVPRSRTILLAPGVQTSVFKFCRYLKMAKFGTVARVPTSPRYGGPPIISIDGAPDDQLIPMIRQRKRFEEMLVRLDSDEWGTPSRCDTWTVRDVAAHLVGVNSFWKGSILAGLAGDPTRMLTGFDPATTPALMVDQMREMTVGAVLERFITSNAELFEVIGALDDGGWMAHAESPAGHVPIRIVAHHALWDCWIHERDIALPIGSAPPAEPDEVLSCLRYVSAFSAAIGVSSGSKIAGALAVEADSPTSSFVLNLGETVAVQDGTARPGAPCLRGDSVELIEAISIRAPLPESSPSEWLQLREGLATQFSPT